MESKRVFEIGLSPKQTEAFEFLQNAAVTELLMGGAKGGGKTVFGCKWVYFFVKSLIQFFGLKKSDTPPVLGFIGRKQSVDFTTTTLNTWKREIPPDAYDIKEQKKILEIEHKASIQFGGLDDQDTIRKFNSAEYAFVWIDQPDECSRQDAGMLRATLRLQLNNKKPSYKILWTPNPVVSDDPELQWLREDFIENILPHRRYLQVLYKDNPFLPEEYGERLEDAFKFNPALLRAYKDGDWSQVGAANVVIPRSIVMECVENSFPWYNQKSSRSTVCDFASGGDDECVIYDLENSKIVNQEIYSHRDDMQSVARILIHAKDNKSTVVTIDKCGNGSGSYSRLKQIYFEQERAREIFIYGFDGRVKPPDGIDSETFYNYKTYAWFKASKEFFQNQRANIPNDPILISQLSAQTWKFVNGKMCLTDKETMKKKMNGRSPDRADAYIMGLDGLQYAKDFESLTNKNKRGNLIYGHPRDLAAAGISHGRKSENPYEGRAMTEKQWMERQKQFA